MIPVQEILEWCVTIIKYWAEQWNNLDTKLVDVWEPGGISGIIDQITIDNFLNAVGLGDATLLGFVLGLNIMIFIAITIAKWITSAMKT